MNKPTVLTKDGIRVEKGSDKYKGHIFYDETGIGYKCLGYFPKFDDCVYINLKTKQSVIGCMDGFYFNNPVKNAKGKDKHLFGTLISKGAKIVTHNQNKDKKAKGGNVYGLEVQKEANGKWELIGSELTQKEAEQRKLDYEKSGEPYHKLRVDIPLAFKTGGNTDQPKKGWQYTIGGL